MAPGDVGAGRLQRRLLTVLTVACAGLLSVLVGAGPAAGQHPAITPDNRPRPVAGHENGRLPDPLLISVAPGCRVERAAGPSLRLLFDLADSNGVPLGTRSCYRPINDQVRVRQDWTARGNSACAAAVQTDASGRIVGTSMHGWGKAADVSAGDNPMTFSSASYGFLVQHAGRVGWNQPGWARPGGGPCPEPWHWEWVGDGGTLGHPALPADAVALITRAEGAWSVVSGLGDVRHQGGPDHGDVLGLPLAWVVVGGDAAGTGTGYYLVGADGGVFAFGAPFLGSTGGLRLNRPIVDMAVAPAATGPGYWLAASDGGVFSFGDARFHGSTGRLTLNRPVVGVAATPSGGGYWLVASDGGVFSFGDARFHGSSGHLRLVEPIMAMAPTPSGDGYWLVAADGGVFSFGDARFHGSAAGPGRTAPIVDIAPTPSGGGYRLLAADGTVIPFGDAAPGG